jgi:Mg2+ and Co2+ transporter CorA
MDKLAAWTNTLEKRMLEKANVDLVVETLDARRDVLAIAQRLGRQREALDRLVRNEVVDISAEMAFRFRHVRDRLIRLSDGAHALDHRLAGLLTAVSALAAGRRWM